MAFIQDVVICDESVFEDEEDAEESRRRVDRLGTDRVGQEEVDVTLGSFTASLAPQGQSRKLDDRVGN